MAMVCNPEVQKKAREELDAVIGPKRMPTFEDRDKLPYIMAIQKECVRWQAVTPLGLPHRSIEDAEYKGYFIPEGTNVLPNQWYASSFTVGGSQTVDADGIPGRWAVTRRPTPMPMPSTPTDS